jgi:hypothetical protein
VVTTRVAVAAFGIAAAPFPLETKLVAELLLLEPRELAVEAGLDAAPSMVVRAENPSHRRKPAKQETRSEIFMR